jgi:hypothetical protein
LFVILQAKQHRAVMDFIPIELSDHLRRSGHFSDETKLAVSPLRPSARRIDDTFIMSAIYNSPAGAHDILMSTTLRPDDGAIEVRAAFRSFSGLNLTLRFLANDHQKSVPFPPFACVFRV